MKIAIFLLGAVIGAGAMYLLTMPGSTTEPSKQIEENSAWQWPDSLDALTAAKENHELVFENEELRILSVTVVPGVLDPVHTHKGKSIVWVTKTSPILYNVYDLKDKKLELVRTDTIVVKPEELNKAVWEKPEPPHSVENIGKETFHLYRIEYKTP